MVVWKLANWHFAIITCSIQFNDSIFTGVVVHSFFYTDAQEVGGIRRQGPLMVSAQYSFPSRAKTFKPLKLSRRKYRNNLIDFK